ncbi:tripartite motif-containing protein 45-like [Macrosteles quadrilineatus]|uniref:tripartite motif-containing protein 45-like n=1 Tax=Macrosteles quadrilineatus TaxID=74068 RepID=UPI0023E30048|nr:tripartite motif-containing protein 45-like [Macrosteles quadrilineatus]
MDQMAYIFGSFSRRRQSSESKGAPKRRSVDVSPQPFSSLRRTKVQISAEDHRMFNCKVCDRQLVEPRVLPCLHTFCTRCLLPITQTSQSQTKIQAETKGGGSGRLGGGSLNGSGSGSGSGSGASGYESEPSSWSGTDPSDQNGQLQVVICPLCKSENKLPNGGISGLPINYVLQNRILQSMQQAPTCDICITEAPASNRCQDCQVNLCSFCCEAHLRERVSAHHEITSLKDVADAALFRRQVMCDAHPNRELRLFCGRCGVVVCRDCCVLLHRGHPCDTAARAARLYAATLRDALDKTRPIAKEANLSLNRLQHLELRIKNHCAEVESEVDRYAESYKAAVEEHRATLRKEVNQVRNNKLTTLHSHHDELHTRSEHTSHAVTFGQELLAEASDVELLTLVTPLLQRLEWCSAGEVIAAIKVSDCLQFLPEERAGLINGHPIFGVITTQAVSPAHCELQTEGLLNCRIHKKAEFTLSTFDCEKQPICHGGTRVAAELRYRDAAQRRVAVHVTDRGDGSYTVEFTPDASGNMSLNVTIQGKHIQGSPFNVSVSTLRPHPGVYHCCTFCSSNGSKEAQCGCGGKMPGGYRGCGHGHAGHPGRRHWSCCGNLLHNSECSRAPDYQYTL